MVVPRLVVFLFPNNNLTQNAARPLAVGTSKATLQATTKHQDTHSRLVSVISAFGAMSVIPMFVILNWNPSYELYVLPSLNIQNNKVRKNLPLISFVMPVTKRLKETDGVAEYARTLTCALDVTPPRQKLEIIKLIMIVVDSDH